MSTDPGKFVEYADEIRRTGICNFEFGGTNWCLPKNGPLREKMQEVMEKIEDAAHKQMEHDAKGFLEKEVDKIRCDLSQWSEHQRAWQARVTAGCCFNFAHQCGWQIGSIG